MYIEPQKILYMNILQKFTTRVWSAESTEISEWGSVSKVIVTGFILLLGLLDDGKVRLVRLQLLNMDFLFHPLAWIWLPFECIIVLPSSFSKPAQFRFIWLEYRLWHSKSAVNRKGPWWGTWTNTNCSCWLNSLLDVPLGLLSHRSEAGLIPFWACKNPLNYRIKTKILNCRCTLTKRYVWENLDSRPQVGLNVMFLHTPERALTNGCLWPTGQQISQHRHGATPGLNDSGCCSLKGADFVFHFSLNLDHVSISWQPLP